MNDFTQEDAVKCLAFGDRVIKLNRRQAERNAKLA